MRSQAGDDTCHDSICENVPIRRYSEMAKLHETLKKEFEKWKKQHGVIAVALVI